MAQDPEISAGGTMHHQRVHTIADGVGEARGGPVLYWMSRDQRVRDHWGLLRAQDLVRQAGAGCGGRLLPGSGIPRCRTAPVRLHARGAYRVEEALRGLNIPFVLLTGRPEEM